MSSKKKPSPIYALFELWMTPEQVREAFVRSFSEQPARVTWTGGGYLAGPVDPKTTEKRRQGDS